MSPKYEFWKDGYPGKKDAFWLLWGIYKDYIKQNIIKGVVRKA